MDVCAHLSRNLYTFGYCLCIVCVCLWQMYFLWPQIHVPCVGISFVSHIGRKETKQDDYFINSEASIKMHESGFANTNVQLVTHIGVSISVVRRCDNKTRLVRMRFFVVVCLFVCLLPYLFLHTFYCINICRIVTRRFRLHCACLMRFSDDFGVSFTFLSSSPPHQ